MTGMSLKVDGYVTEKGKTTMGTNHFKKTFQVTWGDLDANVHLRNTSYLDYAAQVRFLYLNSQGFTPAHFKQAGIGPIVFSEEIRYMKELQFLEEFNVDFRVAGQSVDGSKFIIVNGVFRLDGQVCAEIRTKGAWFNLNARKVTAPPEALKAAFDRLAQTEDYQVLSKSSKPGNGTAPKDARS